MNPRYASRGVECREYDDKKTGRRVVQLTCNAEFESKHAYYDICPWSSDGRYLAFSSARPADLTGVYRDNVSTDHGRVCVMDTSNREIRVIATDAFYASHSGAWPVWLPDGHVLTSRRASGTVILDLDTAAESSMDGGIRQISPDGTLAVGRSPEPQGEKKFDGVCTMNLDGSDPRCIVTRQRLYDLTPNRDQFAFDDMTLGNEKWTPDSRHLLIAMWVKPRPAVRRSLYIVSRDGSECRWLTHFGHHHSWMPDGKAVLFNDATVHNADGSKAEPRMHFINFDGTNRRIVIDRPVGSHPIISPDGRTIADSDREGIYLVHIEAQRIERLTAYARPFDMTHKGTHPHCVWQPDGSHLLYNSAESGHSEVYMVPMSR